MAVDGGDLGRSVPLHLAFRLLLTPPRSFIEILCTAVSCEYLIPLLLPLIGEEGGDTLIVETTTFQSSDVIFW